ncbi:MAG: tetratricopeptide repeat protein [Anaerolineales bacterium]
MTETNNETTENTSSNFFNAVVAVAIAVIALTGSLITKVQSEASTLSSAASNDEQIYYYQAMGEQISGDADTNYEFGTIYQLWDEYNLLATSAEKGGDLVAAEAYRKLRDALVKSSSLLNSEYFDSVTGKLNLVAYKTEKYSLHVIELEEQQSAAADVADAWGKKDSTYVLQLTLLAVAGFLLGLSLMTKSKIARIVFTASGIPMIAIISIWAYLVWKQPVYDLRTTGAIPQFAEGASLIAQKKWQEALAPLSKAIELAGTDNPYEHAYLHRAQANAQLGNFEAAVKDYQFAVDMGDSDPNVVGSLVWALFQTGKFQQAIDAGQTAIEESPDNLWLQLRVGMATLASGDTEAATKQYQNIVKLADQQVKDKRALGDDPSDIWWQLNDAAFQLNKLSQLLGDEKATSPVKDAITEREKVSQAAQEIASLLSETSVSLQYGITNTEVATVFSSPEISLISTDDQLYVYEVDAIFQYTGLDKGQLLTIKVSRNGIEDPSWTYSRVWDQASSGQLTLTLTPAYADVYIVFPGEYEVSVYVNGKILQKQSFTVGEPLADDGEFVFSDMLDGFDFLNMDIFSEDGNLHGEDELFDPSESFNILEGYNIDTNTKEGAQFLDENGNVVACENPDDPACTGGSDTSSGDTTGNDPSGGDTTGDNSGDTGGDPGGNP